MSEASAGGVMETPNIINTKRGPERIIQDAIIDMLKIRDWYVMETHGNMFQRGFPDLYATHSMYGGRWIEVKDPNGFSFTAAQHDCFPKLIANGTGVWVLMGDSEHEYQKLFKPPNFWEHTVNFRRVT